MLATLAEWSSRCTNTLSDIERQIAAIRADALRRAKEEREWNAHVEKLMEPKEGKEEVPKEVAAKSGGMLSGLGKRLGGGGAGKRGSEDHEDDEGEMELDDEDEDMGEKRSTRSSKKRGFGFGK
jgi:COP9 signalosome complex subunit 7